VKNIEKKCTLQKIGHSVVTAKGGCGGCKSNLWWPQRLIHDHNLPNKNSASKKSDTTKNRTLQKNRSVVTAKGEKWVS
jgi:hypothetical protein